MEKRRSGGGRLALAHHISQRRSARDSANTGGQAASGTQHTSLDRIILDLDLFGETYGQQQDAVHE